MAAAQNLSHDRQFRYIICWFSEFSELQREDFYPILIEYLSQNTTENGNGVYMNGLVNSVGNVGINNKPMSLFQCRMKLFREWSTKWPLDFKQKLKEKIIEIDPTMGEKIMHEIKAHNGNGLSNGLNDNNDDETVTGTETDDIVNATEEAIISDNHLIAVLNETSVDDDNEVVDAQINVVQVIEPTGQAQTYTVQQPQHQPEQQQQDHAIVISTQALLNNSAEVPLVA